jgi:hypothetical protein
MIGKYFNFKFDGGSPNIPVALGDRYFGQDLVRDNRFLMDRLGHVAKDLHIDPPFIITGGQVSQGTLSTLNITACVGYIKFNVDIPGTWGASPPPPVTSERIESIRVESPIQTNMALPGLVTGGATNYVKLKYKEKDLNSRTRARKAGSYYYEQEPSFEFVVDGVPPGVTEILLDTFTESGGTFTFTAGRSPEHTQIPRLPAKNAIYNSGTITLPHVAHLQTLRITGNILLNTRIIVVEEDLIIDSGVTVTCRNYANKLVSHPGTAGGSTNYPELMFAGRGGLATGPKKASGGYGGYTCSAAIQFAGAGGYTTQGGNYGFGGNPGGLPYIDVSKFGIATIIGGNGGASAASSTGSGGGGLSGGGGASSIGGETGGEGGSAVLIIVKGNLINNGTIIANGDFGIAGNNGGGGGGGIFLIALGPNNIMGTLNAKGGSAGIGGNGGGGGGGHIATLRASGSAPTSDVSGGSGQGTGTSGSSGTVLNKTLETNRELGLGNWGDSDVGILTANFIYQVFGYGWSVFV